jgi:hypothetical protein
MAHQLTARLRPHRPTSGLDSQHFGGRGGATSRIRRGFTHCGNFFLERKFSQEKLPPSPCFYMKTFTLCIAQNGLDISAHLSKNVA